jgi:hypothetical protein
MSPQHTTRRQFFGTTSAIAGVAFAPHWFRAAPASNKAFSFVLLGDVHYDKAEHHDLGWAKQTKSTTAISPGFVQKTREILPPLFASVRDTIADLNRNPATRVAFVLQVGDLVQGACGNEELATRQNSDARAFVLSGHLHRYCSLGRQTPRGRFAQFALSSVIYGPDVQPMLELSGLKDYSGDQVRVEPRFSPETEALRRALFELEKPSITAFDFADLPGYAVVTVDGPRVIATMFRGITRDAWRTLDLSGLLA